MRSACSTLWVPENTTFDYRYTLEPVDGGRIRLELQAECRTTALLWGLLGPFIRFGMRRVDAAQPEALKAVVEAELKA